MARQYYRENVTVHTYDSASMLAEIGSGEITVTYDTAENNALNDSWKSSITTVGSATFSGELAADSTGTQWITKAGDEATFTFTGAGVTVTGSFHCTSASMMLDDAVRYRVELQSNGEVTIS